MIEFNEFLSAQSAERAVAAEQAKKEKARAARKMKAFAKAEALGFICD